MKQVALSFSALFFTLSPSTGAFADANPFDGLHFAPIPYSPIKDNDRVENLLGHPAVTKLVDMDTAGLRSATLGETPWSDSYWPMHRGGIAIRYADPSFPNSSDWRRNYSYYKSHSSKHAAKHDVDSLSPAEKYDYLLGDSNWTLTTAAWEAGQDYENRTGAVPTWMGICHGWAPAAITEKEPLRSVDVRSVDGREIRFYPTDIKALVDQLWASGRFKNHFIGSRCTTENPGAAHSGPCSDSNPATFHLALVNEIGIAHHGFVMDANTDAEVWNYPIYSYSFSLFNPVTEQAAYSISDAAVDVASFSNDPYRSFRSPQARRVVGVSMTVSYAVEIVPTHYEGPQRATKSVTYKYDLELSDAGDIIGGEWYSKAHPDFLWGPESDAQVLSVGDTRIGDANWDPSTPVPGNWVAAAIESSSYSTPLAAIVNGLKRASQ